MAQEKSIGEFFLENPQFDIFSIPEEERIFKEVGLHTVIMDRGESLVIRVHECGGYTTLEHVIPEHGQQIERA